MMNEPVSTVMSQAVVTLKANDTMKDVHYLIVKHKISHIPIVDARKMIGIISVNDLLKVQGTHEDLENLKIEDYMTKKVAFLEPDDKVGAAAEVLMEHLFHAVPICDEHHNLLGLVTLFDLVKYSYNKEYEQ